jgi:GntR family transcriptional regulator
LRDLLRSAVMAGMYGDGMPSEAALMVAHQATRGVVRGALELLRQEGVVERVRGQGTFVVSERVANNLLEMSGVQDPTSTTGILGDAPLISLIDRQEISLPEQIAGRLRAPAGSPCLRLEFLAINRGRVSAIGTNYLLYPEAERLASCAINSTLYTTFQHAGISVGGCELQISAVNTDELIAPFLGIAVGTAILCLEQVILDEDGRPYDFAVGYVRGDCYSILSRVMTDPQRPWPL